MRGSPKDCKKHMDPRIFSVAPMVDVTSSTFRRMVRVMTQRAMLYTEMIAADAIVHGKEHLIDFKDEELPLTLQIGGNDPVKLAYACKVAEKRGYSAVNLNAGCPSDKVQSGAFGAILMKDPKRLGELFAAMQDAVTIPVSVKTRIGVDEADSFDYTLSLVSALYDAGCRDIILHARKAWLNGLSPKENRTVPPLDYARVYVLKSMFPDVFFTINGGVLTLEECKEHLRHVDGVMLGRAIIDNPYLLASVDQEIFGGETEIQDRDTVLERMVALGHMLQDEGQSVHHLCRHLMGLYQGVKGARRFRRYLSDHMTALGTTPEILYAARDATALIC